MTGSGSAVLSWTNPADSDFVRVEITFTPTVAGITQPISVPGGTQTRMISGLYNGMAYTFTVKAVDAAGNKSTGISRTATPLGSDPNLTYRVGDTGPAGGLIFYVKSNYNDGWKYLEAAPASTEVTRLWSSGNYEITGTDTSYGAGKTNTAKIMAYQTSTGHSCLAAEYCDSLRVGDFDDWFLPSMDELNYMHLNLKSNGNGGFSNNWYWSSSEVSGYYASSSAQCQNFTNGERSSNGKSNTFYVRAARAF
jgi:hypothetical protein